VEGQLKLTTSSTSLVQEPGAVYSRRLGIQTLNGEL